MDFNTYVDILLLDHKNEQKSQYINGCVYAKNLADKRMPHLIKNPSILLLKGSLGFMREFENDNEHSISYTDINSIINQEELFVNIISEKIMMTKPNVIVTEKDISFKMLEVLRNKQIAAITNMPIEKMRKLARLTKTIIVPSPNVLQNNIQLGSCQVFKVENPVTQNLLMSKTTKHTYHS